MRALARWVSAFAVCACAAIGHAQSKQTEAHDPSAQTPQVMQERIDKLEGEVSELKAIVKQLQSGSPASEVPVAQPSPGGTVETKVATEQQNSMQAEDRKALDFLQNTMINLGIDTYYTYNFNHPVGRVNMLRAYDVLSNEFSVNQASVILEHAPNLNAGSYVTWNATPKMTLALEGDYFIQRLWQNSAPGQSSAPLHTDGGAAYIQYQVTPKIALASRAEYMSDRGALFSGISQALKENTVTLDYKVSDGLLMRYEWRRDFSNQPSFLSDVQGVLRKEQNTATLGLVWWWGRKEALW
jgi:Putative beta-barrel porin-2, OmpL-like. bbp2